jgi:hypothetical protein
MTIYRHNLAKLPQMYPPGMLTQIILPMKRLPTPRFRTLKRTRGNMLRVDVPRQLTLFRKRPGVAAPRPVALHRVGNGRQCAVREVSG